MLRNMLEVEGYVGCFFISTSVLNLVLSEEFLTETIYEAEYSHTNYNSIKPITFLKDLHQYYPAFYTLYTGLFF